MLEILTIGTPALYAVTAAILGLRLLRVGRTSGAGALGFLGAALVSAAVLEVASVAVAIGGVKTPVGPWRAAFVVIYVSIGGAVGCMMRFTQMLYHPKRRILKLVSWLTAAHLAVAAAIVPFSSTPIVESPLALSIYPLLMAAYLWTSVESFRCWLRYRGSEGLDPLVVDRFRMWGLGAFLVVLWVLVSFVGRTSAWGQAAGSSIGLASSLALWFAFRPPAFWRRHLTAARA